MGCFDTVKMTMAAGVSQPVDQCGDADECPNQAERRSKSGLNVVVGQNGPFAQKFSAIHQRELRQSVPEKEIGSAGRLSSIAFVVALQGEH